MTFLDHHDRAERIAARCDERRSGEPMATEAITSAYLHAMRLRGEDVRMTMRECDPPAAYDHEADRLDASRRWMTGYFARRPV